MSNYRVIDKKLLEQLLSELKDELKRNNLQVSLYIVGGGAIILGKEQLNRDRLTDDVDVRLDIFSKSGISHEKAEKLFFSIVGQIGQKHNIRADWLNSEGKKFFGDSIPKVKNRKYLDIRIATPGELLAMKIVAGRSKDAEDIRRLIKFLQANKAGAKRLLQSFYPNDYLEELVDERGFASVDSLVNAAFNLVSTQYVKNENTLKDWHINDKGEVKPCNAIVRRCRFHPKNIDD